jgi:hypothetical protein
MSPRRLLVVATAPLEESDVRERLKERAGEAAEIRVIAPASDVSPLEWLASDEDEAREEAAEVAREAKQTVEPEAPVEAQVGDTDPVQAIEDALRQFPADEVVVVTRPGDEAGWLEKGAAGEAEERFGVPVTRITVDR